MARHRRGLRASNIDWSAFGFTIVQWSADGKGWRFTTLGYLKAISSIIQYKSFITGFAECHEQCNHWFDSLLKSLTGATCWQNIQNRTLSGKLFSLEFPLSFWLSIWLFLFGKDYTDTICPKPLAVGLAEMTSISEAPRRTAKRVTKQGRGYNWHVSISFCGGVFAWKTNTYLNI